MADLAAGWLQPFFAFWVDAMLAVVAGSLAVGGVIPKSAEPSLLRLIRGAVVLLGIGLGAYLCAATVAMTDTSLADFPGYLRVVLEQTDFGTMVWVAAFAWLVLMGAVFVVCGTASRTSGRLAPQAFVLGVLGVVVVAYARAATGHAADRGFLSLAVLVHTGHVLTGCLWAGSVVAAVRFIDDWRTWTLPAQRWLAHRLSDIATVVVPLVAATGIANAFRTLGGAMHVWDSPYLWILVAKLVLVGAAVALGSWNRWVWMVRLDHDRAGSLHGFVTVLAIEAVTLVGVLLLAARLGTTATPM